MKKRYVLILLAFLLCAALAVSAVAARSPRMVDDADLLSSVEEDTLQNELDRVSREHQLDIVIVTTGSLNGKSPRAYADDFYDNNGYGFGSDYDGVLLLVSMEDRDWYISTCGYGIRVFTDAGIEYIGDQIVSDLSDGDYADAFDEFIRLCDEFITQAKSAEPYDYHNLPKEPFDVGFSLVISLIIGLVVGLIVALALKGQLRSVKKQYAAEQYLKPGSLHLTEATEFFLYNTLRKVEKPKNNGGSGTHFSSSGRSHGGGGGKF